MFYSSPYPLEKGTKRSAGFDITCNKDTIIFANGSSVIPTGLKIAFSAHTFGLVTLRSGHGFKRGLTCHTGIIDNDYRGEIKVKVFNNCNYDQVIEKGERFAQLIILPMISECLYRVDDIDEDTDRGSNGFGSTGVV